MYNMSLQLTYFAAKWEEHPEVSDMIELQKRGMVSPSSRDGESKGGVKGHTDSTSPGVARGEATKVSVSTANKFELLMGGGSNSDDDGD